MKTSANYVICSKTIKENSYITKKKKKYAHGVTKSKSQRRLKYRRWRHLQAAVKVTHFKFLAKATPEYKKLIKLFNTYNIIIREIKSKTKSKFLHYPVYIFVQRFKAFKIYLV